MKTGRTTIWAALLAALLLAFVGATPALAHHKPGHEGGPGKDKSGQHQNDSDDEGDDTGDESDDGGNGPQDQNGDGKPGNGPKGDKDNNGGGNDDKEDDAGITDGALGNNGTIKIDGEPFDTSHGNEPHVGCTMRVLYFGMDSGDDLTSTLTFEAHAPTSGDWTLTDTITLGPDEVDIAGPYDLGAMLLASGIEPHAQQGWHVKLTTNSEYSQGADVKHKVFWVKCDETEEQGGAVVKAAKVGMGSDNDDSGSESAEVLGESTERAPIVLGSSEEADARSGLLPFTGANLLPFIVLGFVLIAAGWSLTRLRRSN